MAHHGKYGGYGWRKDSLDPRDHWFAAPYDIVSAVPPTSDLRAGFPDCYDQGQLGSCVANGTGGLVEFGWRRQKLPDYCPSRLFIYYQGRVLEHTVSEDSGLEVRDGMKVVAKYGAPHEHEWEYDISRFTVRPPPKAYTDALLRQAIQYARVQQTLQQLRGCLASGFPFTFGFCMHGDTLIHTPSGDVPIRSLVGQQPWVFSWKGDELKLGRASKVWLTRPNAKCIRVSYEWMAHGERKTDSIICTPSHPFLMLDGRYMEAGKLSPGDRLTPFGQRIGTPGQIGQKKPRAYVKCSGLRKGTGAWQKRSHWVWEQLNGERAAGAHVHPEDRNTLNDSPENLSALDGKAHISIHSTEWWETSSPEMISERNGRVTTYQQSRSTSHVANHAEATRASNGRRKGIPQAPRSASARENMRAGWTEERRVAQAARLAKLNYQRLAGKAVTADRMHEAERNHKVTSVIPYGYADVYDMEVPEFHNFAANHVFVHNSVYESFESDAVANGADVPMPNPYREQRLGGHCVVGCGHDDASRTFWVRNSWGKSWCRDGYCRMPYELLASAVLASDFWKLTLMEQSTAP